MMLQQMKDYQTMRESAQMTNVFESNTQHVEISEQKPDSPTLKVPIFFEEKNDMI